MATRITVSNITPHGSGDTYKAAYRVKGTTTYTTRAEVFNGPSFSFDISAEGFLYDIKVWRLCDTTSGGSHTETTDCDCPDGTYTPTDNGCEKWIDTPPLVQYEDQCWAKTGHDMYSKTGTRIYKTGAGTGFSANTIFLPIGTSSTAIDTVAMGGNVLTNHAYWWNGGLSPVNGPMNRSAVWVDLNSCDSNADAIGNGLVQIEVNHPGSGFGIGQAYGLDVVGPGTPSRGITGRVQIMCTDSSGEINNTSILDSGYGYKVGDTLIYTPPPGVIGVTWPILKVQGVESLNATLVGTCNHIGTSNKIMYVGIGGRDEFKLVVNGVEIVDTLDATNRNSTASKLAYEVWHLIPVTIVPGINYFNAIARGNGTMDNAISMVVYNKTAAELKIATNDTTAGVIFDSKNERSTDFIDLATCGDGYSLDESYHLCVQKEVIDCNTTT